MTVGPAGGAIVELPIRILALAHGDFEHVTSLNPEFRPGVKRLRLTMEISRAGSRPRAARLAAILGGFLPTLPFHRCCGRTRSAAQFAEGQNRASCGALPGADDDLEIAHLVEHVAIDAQHFVARMDVCSGITGAWIDPLDRYDVFLECDEEPVGRLCAGLAVDLVGSVLQGAEPDPLWRCALHVARLARDHAGAPVTGRLSGVEAAWGRETVAEAVRDLQRRGFLTERRMSLNFSAEPLLAFEAATSTPVLPAIHAPGGGPRP